MGLLQALDDGWGGYLSVWSENARGYQGYQKSPFMQPSKVDDRLSLISALSLHEHWQR